MPRPAISTTSRKSWCPSDGYQQQVLPLIRAAQQMGNDFVMNGDQLTRFMALVVPNISPYVKLEIDPAIQREHLPASLEIALTLDYPQRNTIRGRLRFRYGKVAFNPLTPEDIPPQLLRDIEAENAFAALLDKYRFSVNEDEWLLAGEEQVYDFLHDGLPEMMPLAQIDIEDTLNRVKPRQAMAPHMEANVSHGVLELRFDEKVYGMDVFLEVLAATAPAKNTSVSPTTPTSTSSIPRSAPSAICSPIAPFRRKPSPKTTPSSCRSIARSPSTPSTKATAASASTAAQPSAPLPKRSPAAAKPPKRRCLKD